MTLRPGDLVKMIPYSFDVNTRAAWHWSVDVETARDSDIRSVNVRRVYLVLALRNDKWSTRWALITDGSEMVWQRIDIIEKLSQNQAI